MSYPFQLPELGYAYNALEPHIDARTMEIHHQKHHGGYTNNFNKALEGHPQLHSVDAEHILRGFNGLPSGIQTAVRNNGGGYYNHALFWEILTPGGSSAPTGELAAAIDQHFGASRNLQGRVRRRRRHSIRLRMGLVGHRSFRKAPGPVHGQPGQPPHGGAHPGPGAGRVGTRLLPELPESPSRLHHGILECGELGQGGRAVRSPARWLDKEYLIRHIFRRAKARGKGSAGALPPFLFLRDSGYVGRNDGERNGETLQLHQGEPGPPQILLPGYGPVRNHPRFASKEVASKPGPGEADFPLQRPHALRKGVFPRVSRRGEPRPRARSTSLTEQSTRVERTASTLSSAKGRDSATPCTSSTDRPSFRAVRRKWRCMKGFGSTPTIRNSRGR